MKIARECVWHRPCLCWSYSWGKSDKNEECKRENRSGTGLVYAGHTHGVSLTRMKIVREWGWHRPCLCWSYSWGKSDKNGDCKRMGLAQALFMLVILMG